ncbi:protein takeout-like [Choristoneura fumiferana]
MSMKDIYVEGLKAAKVHDARIRADEDRFHLEVDMTTPRVFVQGNYFGEGRFNSLTFNASGMFNTTMTDLVYTWKLDGVPEKRDNETYVRIKSFYMRPDVGNLESYVSNDIPESQGIIQLANDFANANWRPLYRELLPYAQDNWNKIGIRIANKLFLKVPYDKMFPA